MILVADEPVKQDFVTYIDKAIRLLTDPRTPVRVIVLQAAPGVPVERLER